MSKNNDLWIERAAYIEKLESELAAAKAEIEKWKAYADKRNTVALDANQQLAARDLVIKQLREAVYWLKLKTDPKYGYPIAEKALALQPTTKALDEFVQRAVLEEREACAALCDDAFADNIFTTHDAAIIGMTTTKCAEAIRGRKP